MAYIGFDLDETLGCFTTVDGALNFIMPSIIYNDQFRGREPFTPSAGLRLKLDVGFQKFVELLAAKEPSIGILRPGILEIIHRFAELKSEGRVKSMIVYSNNGNLACLKLGTRLIEELLKLPGLFCNLVHALHPIRKNENIQRVPGKLVKTTITLQKIFLHSECTDDENEGMPTDVSEQKMYFFDDLVHPDILGRVGPERYFLVSPYKHDADYNVINECLVNAFIAADLDTDQEFFAYIQPILNTYRLPSTYDNIFVALDLYKNKYPILKYAPFDNDTDYILSRINTQFPHTHIGGRLKCKCKNKYNCKCKKRKNKSRDRRKKHMRSKTRRGPAD